MRPLRRWTVGTRLVLVLVLCLPPLLTILGFYVAERREERAVAARELAGLQVLREVRSLAAELIASREDARVGGEADRGIQHRLEARAPGMRRMFAQVSTALVAEGHHAVAAAVDRLAARWEATTDQPIEATVTDARYTTLLRELRAVTTDIGQTSHILLDPEAESYWLAVQLVQTLPTIESIRYEYSALARPAIRGGVTQTDRGHMTTLGNRLDHELAVLAQGYRASGLASADGLSDPHVAQRLQSVLATHQTVHDLVRFRLLQVDQPYLRAAELEEADRAAVAAGMALWDASADRLEVLLNQRIARVDRRTTTAILSTLSALAVTAWFVALVLRSIRRPLRNAAAAARRIRDGDLDAEIPDHRGDEVGDLLESISELLGHLRTLAYSDGLTGLPNRALFSERLGDAVADLRAGEGVAVMFCDVDRFKEINDSMGHAAGDELLTAVAARLRDSVRSDDLLARFGGDEFTVLLRDVPCSARAVAVAERAKHLVERPYLIRGETIHTSLSVGIAFSDRPSTTPGDLLRDADIALYRSKETGRGQHTVFVEDMSVGALERLQLQSDLRQALHRGDLRLHYQPGVSLRTGKSRFVEALMRWERPGHGLIPPDQFIPLAEAEGLIVPFGRWVLLEACEQVAAWRREHGFDLGLSVNVSPRQLDDEHLVGHVQEALGRSGLPADRLRLEITESSLVDDRDETLRPLYALRALGVGIALDDFGTGYSSLGILQRLPIDALKIDRSLIAGVDVDPAAARVVRAISEMAHALAMQVVVEGVETDGQRRALLAQGCTTAQGFLFARPLPAEDLGAYLRTARSAGESQPLPG